MIQWSRETGFGGSGWRRPSSSHDLGCGHLPLPDWVLYFSKYLKYECTEVTSYAKPNRINFWNREKLVQCFIFAVCVYVYTCKFLCVNAGAHSQWYTCGAPRKDHYVSPHFPLSLRYSLFLFATVYTRLSCPWASGNSPVSASHLLRNTAIVDALNGY